MNPTALDMLLEALDGLVVPAAREAADELRRLAGDVNPSDPAANWKLMAIETVANLVETQGVDGVDLAFDAIRRAVVDKPLDIDVLDARISHLLIASIEREEVLTRRQVTVFFRELGVVFGNVGKAFLAAAMRRSR